MENIEGLIGGNIALTENRSYNIMQSRKKPDATKENL